MVLAKVVFFRVENGSPKLNSHFFSCFLSILYLEAFYEGVVNSPRITQGSGEARTGAALNKKEYVVRVGFNCFYPCPLVLSSLSFICLIWKSSLFIRFLSIAAAFLSSKFYWAPPLLLCFLLVPGKDGWAKN